MDPIVEKLLADAEAAIQAERAAQPAAPATMDLAPVVEKAIKLYSEKLDAEVAAKVDAALAQSREGVGRVAQSIEQKASTSLESDALAHLVRKAKEVNFEDADALSQDEKDAIVGFWNVTFWGDPNAVVAEKQQSPKR